jgi:hypothetical protein
MGTDPYLLDKDEAKKMKEEAKVRSVGVFCPKRNKQIGKRCFVCEKLQPLWNFPEKSKEREIAKNKSVKANFYLQVVFPSNPNELVILELGKKAGSDILDGIEDQGWTDIAHPVKGKGREMKITKKKGELDYHTYKVSPILEKADWSIPDSILGNLYNLDNILDLLIDPNTKIFKVTSLKLDESLTFRICPPWNADSGNRRIMTVVWRHWGGITQDEVDGITEVSLDLPEEKEEKKEDTTQHLPWKSGVDINKPRCFGNSDFYEEDSDLCKKCQSFKECKAALK